MATLPKHVIVHEGALIRFRERLNEDIVVIVERQLKAIKKKYPTFPLETLGSIPKQYPCEEIYVVCGMFLAVYIGASINQTILASQKAGYDHIYISPIGVLPDSALVRK